MILRSFLVAFFSISILTGCPGTGGPTEEEQLALDLGEKYF